jgi:MFS transporter, YNFM family, putative membrane transport protein
MHTRPIAAPDVIPRPAEPLSHDSGGTLWRQAAIGLMAFLTLVDLFATQAILPSLAAHYRVGAAAMGLAVNASTLGMAAGALAFALFGRRIDRRRGVTVALALLALPTLALAAAPDLASFAALRIVQGLAMSAAFALALSYLAEQCSARAAAGAFAMYVTGNVASNLFGRLFSAALADHFGIATNFLVFAALNLAGAALAWASLRPAVAMPMPGAVIASPRAVLRAHLREPALRASFAIGFLILFAFIGTFTYVNFVLARPPLALAPMALGFVYFVFAPALLTTPLAGRGVARWGTRPAFRASLGVAGLGLPLLLAPSLAAVVAGLALVGAGTFFAQAAATGFVGRHASADPGSASGLYLASYFSGGLAGAFVVGQVFERFGWPAAVLAVGMALAAAAALAGHLHDIPTRPQENP